METSIEHSEVTSLESVSENSAPDSEQAMNMSDHAGRRNAGISRPIEINSDAPTPSTQNIANDEGNESDTDIIILPIKQESVEESERIESDFITIPNPEADTSNIQQISTVTIVLRSEFDSSSETILPHSDPIESCNTVAPSADQTKTSGTLPSLNQNELCEVIILNPNQTVSSEGVILSSDQNEVSETIVPSSNQSASSEMFVPSSNHTASSGIVDPSSEQTESFETIVPTSELNEMVTDRSVSNAEVCSTSISSQIDSDITPKHQLPISPTRVTTRSSSRKRKLEQITSNVMSPKFKVPYPVQTTVEIEEMDTDVQNESTLSADSSLLNNSYGSTSDASGHVEGDNSMEQHSEAVVIEKILGSLYVEDEGPRIYDIPKNLTSKPLNPIHLPYAFKDLPIFGRPRSKAELPKFQMDKIRKFVGGGMDDEEFEDLAAFCCPDNLRTGKELVMQSSPGQGFYPSEVDSLSIKNKEVSATHKLNIVRKLKLRIDRDTKNLYSKRFKYRGVRMIPLSTEDEDSHPVVTIGQPIIPGKELLFVIRWYRPFPYNPKDRFGYRSRHSVFSSNIVMLGRHKLSLLRDRVVCPNDVDMRVDVSEMPDELPRSSAKELFPSGFLFINNVFYVDRRAGCVDYSERLRSWAHSRGLGDFPCRDMCDVRLDELTLKLGHPDVYVHQGNCEHLFTVSEVRLLAPADPLRLAAYPAHSMLSQNQTIYCTTCAEFGAKWIVVGSPRVPFDPAFFCEKCFKLYLYKDGKKIGNFKAYLYRGNEINALKPQG